MNLKSKTDLDKAAAITRAASRQTDLTIRHLVDKGMVADAYRAYGYFRWVDDRLDQESCPRHERLAFITRQKNLVDACYHGQSTGPLVPEETMLVNLIARDCEPNSGLQTYIRKMMSVMAFDADRRGRLISKRELDEYTVWLATAVTEAMHYFIGHCSSAPKCDARYLAVSGAHITHMLRDTVEDVESGYYNIPCEVLAANQIKPEEVSAPAYREWVEERVQKARRCFALGREYLDQVESLRCRLAGFAYMHRFEVVLDTIEQEGYVLKRQYPERKQRGRGFEMIGTALGMAMKVRQFPSLSSIFRPQVKS